MITNRKYSKFEEQKVKDADLRLIIPGVNRRKASQTVDCPQCQARKKFYVDMRSGHHSAHCYACDLHFSNAIQAVMYYHHIPGNEYLRALETTAEVCGIVLVPEERARAERVREVAADNVGPFCKQQLDGSGLTEEDVMATAIINDVETMLSPFVRGKVDSDFNPSLSGDEMLIFYYDLEGRPMTYKAKGVKHPRPYLRVRWSNPAIHNDHKYMTAKGATCRVFIPEAIRRMYRNRTQIDTLFLQEGEKKAEKACKHGMPSLGIQGINNFGSKDEGLLQDIQDVAKVCRIKNIVLVMDSDWNDLSRTLSPGERVDKRPNSFARAVIKYRQYMRTLNAIGLSVNVWWGHVNENENGDKGVDDLLCGSLRDREGELMQDVTRAMNSHNGRGVWLNIHKITEESDTKILDFWLLNDAQAFYEKHKARLREIETFKIGQLRFKIDDDKLVPISRYSSDLDIYTVETDSKEREKVVMQYDETFNFLNACGFHRLRDNCDGTAGFSYIRIDDGIIDPVAAWEMRDFVQEYILQNCRSRLVREFFQSKLDQLLPDKKLERLKIIPDPFNNFESGVQRTYYQNGQVEITSESITPNKPIINVWRSRIIKRNFKRVPVIKSIIQENGKFYIEFTEEGNNCEFAIFLSNTSNNYYQFGHERDLTEEEGFEWAQHVVNKITTLGYLLCDFKFPDENRCVVVQDHSMSEVGQSFGGVGKSIFGKSLSRIVPQEFIDGKSLNWSDQFLWSGVTRATRSVFIDDVRANFNFENMFTLITGDMKVNPKNDGRFTITEEQTPKFIITTNHAINKANEASYQRRIGYVEFSNWYNPDHTPTADFGHFLFNDWDAEQWNLFDNFMAECVMYYLRSREGGWCPDGTGAVPPPMHNVELRTLRQFMGETFLMWAEEYFDPQGQHLNDRESRKDMYAELVMFDGDPNKYGVTRSNFRRKIEAFCKFKGYDFNIYRPNKDNENYKEWKAQHPTEVFIGEADKSGGREYFTVYSEDKPKQAF